MKKINFLPLIDKEEKNFNLSFTDLELSYLTKENDVFVEKIDSYFKILDNVRHHVYKGSNKRVLRLLLIAKILRNKKIINQE